jgi:hypothetical protein
MFRRPAAWNSSAGGRLKWLRNAEPSTVTLYRVFPVYRLVARDKRYRMESEESLLRAIVSGGRH